MEISEQIVKVLDVVGDKIGVAVDWTSTSIQSNIMPYIQELTDKIVSYEIWTSVVWIVVFIMLLSVVSAGAKKALHSEDEADNFVGWLLFIPIGVFLVCIIIQTLDIVTALTLPEKTVLDFMTRMYNNTINGM
jgi:uncharacterized membrane protein (DUF485 family)